MRYLKQNKLVELCAQIGRMLHERLRKLTELPNVGDVRGRELLAGIEFVGDAANLNWFDPGTIAFASDTGGGGGGGGGGGLVRFGYVSVSRGTVSSGGATQTFLFFSITECDVSFSFCNTVRGGFGTIPNDDFTVGGKTLQVHTNTSANPDFSTFAGPAGAVDVVWQMNGLFTVRSSGTTERSQPGFREHDVGQSTDVSANASGTVVGLPVFPVNQADISSNRSLTININR